jgi:hypothetical protein
MSSGWSPVGEQLRRLRPRLPRAPAGPLPGLPSIGGGLRATRRLTFRRAGEVIMTPTPDDAPLRTIREIREALPEHQQHLFDAEVADTDIDELPVLLSRWATPGTDGFEEFLLSTPFEGLEFGARSYDTDPDAE